MAMAKVHLTGEGCVVTIQASVGGTIAVPRESIIDIKGDFQFWCITHESTNCADEDLLGHGS